MRPHAVAGAELPTPVVHAGLLQRIIELRPYAGVGEIGSLSGRGGDQAGRVVDADQRARVDQENRSVMHDGVRSFGDHVVPCEFRHDDLLRLAGEPRRTSRVKAGDPDAADLLPCVVPAARIAQHGHVKRNALDRIERLAIRVEDGLGHRPVLRLARIEISAVGMLLELHDVAAAGPHVRFAGTIVGGAVGIDARSVEARHEQN